MSKALYTLVYSAFLLSCNSCIVWSEWLCYPCLMIMLLRHKRHYNKRFMVLYIVSVVWLLWWLQQVLLCVVVLLYCLFVVVLLLCDNRDLQGCWCVSCGRCDKIIVLLGVIVLLVQCVGLLWCCGQFGIWLVGLWIKG